MSFSYFFPPKPTESLFVPGEILTFLKNLHATQHKKIRVYNRELEFLRLDLLAMTIDRIQAFLETDPDDLRICKMAITHLLCNNLQQTKNHSQWQKMKDQTPGDIHKACANLLPSALIDALLILRTRPSHQIIRISHICEDEGKYPIEIKNETIRARPRFSLEEALSGIDTDKIKLISENPYLKLLKQEIDFETKFSNMKMEHLFKRSQDLLLRAKELHTYHAMHSWDREKIIEFKKALINLSSHLENETLLILNEYIIHLELMDELITQGNFLYEKMIEMFMKPISRRESAATSPLS